jgi:molybdate transport system ATP-binding protein
VSGEPLLQGRVRARFGRFELDSSITLAERGISAVFGPSGCGKSLLLRWLAGLIQVRDAELSCGGELWQQGRKCLPTHRRGLGYVAQQPALFPHLSVRENLEFGYRRSQVRRVSPETVIEALSLAPLFGQPVDTLSGGQRQRLAIGRALLCSPRLLLLDEPLSALDRPARLAILRDLRRLQAELDVPMLYVSHAAEEIERLADHVLLMREGRLSPPQPIAQLCADPAAPLDPDSGPVNLLDTETLEFDAADALAALGYGDLQLRVPSTQRPPARARLRISAREIALAKRRPEQASFQNVLPMRIDSLLEVGIGRVALVCASAGGARLQVELTARAVRELELETGQSVWLLLKALALLD